MSESKLFNDPVHGHIQIDPFLVDVIDTRHFQRLRDLKQLGLSYYVFPGACHNRFEHSIGVCHLSGEMVNRIKYNQPDLDISEQDIQNVQLAGLCHDLGHGPFSHVFDAEFLPRVTNVHWEHEQGSKMLFEHLIDSYSIDLSTSDVKNVLELIDGSAGKRSFLFDIVANKRNSVDVDKFDYLARDCYYSGSKSSYDHRRLMMTSRVIDDKICFHAKEAYNLYEMFHTRYTLFKKIYTHKVCKAIEYMVIDTLVEADQVLGLSKMIHEPESYIYLTDSILNEIERSMDPRLEGPRSLLRRLRDRDIYKFVDEYYYSEHAGKIIKKTRENEQEIAKQIVSYQTYDAPLTINDVIVEIAKINYAMKDRNPVDSIDFYSRYDMIHSLKISKEKISALIPNQFEETICRVYTRDSQKVKAVQLAFRRYLAKETHGPNTQSMWNECLTIPKEFDGSPRKKGRNTPETESKITMKRQLDYNE